MLNLFTHLTTSFSNESLIVYTFAADDVAGAVGISFDFCFILLETVVWNFDVWLTIGEIGSLFGFNFVNKLVLWSVSKGFMLVIRCLSSFIFGFIIYLGLYYNISVGNKSTTLTNNIKIKETDTNSNIINTIQSLNTPIITPSISPM